eukprot:1194753-Pyramimonas_sp.AAC.1
MAQMRSPRDGTKARLFQHSLRQCPRAAQLPTGAVYPAVLQDRHRASPTHAAQVSCHARASQVTQHICDQTKIQG